MKWKSPSLVTGDVLREYTAESFYPVIEDLKAEISEIVRNPELRKAMMCSQCGAPLHGDRCEYCGARYHGISVRTECHVDADNIAVDWSYIYQALRNSASYKPSKYMRDFVESYRSR